MTETLKLNESPRISSKVADVDREMNRMKESLGKTIQELESRETQIENLKSELKESKEAEKDCSTSKKTIEDQENELEKMKESENSMIETLTNQTKQLEQTKILLEESKIEIATLKENLERVQENEKVSSLKFYEELNFAKKELKSAMEAEITSKKAMDELALALKEMKEQLEEERKGAQKEQKENFAGGDENTETLLEESRKEAELQKNTAERLRFEAEESLLAWNGKEAVFVNCIRRGEEEKNSLIEENDKLVQALVTADNLSKKSKEENNKLRDILRQAITEANLAKEAAGIARVENTQLKDNLLDKEETLEILEGEIEVLKSNLTATNEKIADLKRELDDANSAIADSKRELDDANSAANEKIDELKRSLDEANSIDESKHLEENSQVLKLIRAIEKDEERKSGNEETKKRKHKREEENGKRESKTEHEDGKKEREKEKKEVNHEKRKQKEEAKKEREKDKKLGKTCSFSLYIPMRHKDAEEDTNKTPNQCQTQTQTETDKSNRESPVSDSDLFKGSIFDVAETPNAGVTHHRKTSSCDFFEEETLNYPEDLEDGEIDKNARKKKAFIRRFGDLLVRRKSLSKKETSPEQHLQQEKQVEKSPETQTQHQQQQDVN